MNHIEILLVECLFWRWRFVACNPDIGMGPKGPGILEDILVDTGLDIPDGSREKVLSAFKEKISGYCF